MLSADRIGASDTVTIAMNTDRLGQPFFRRHQRYGVAMKTIVRAALAAALLAVCSLAQGDCSFNSGGGSINFAPFDPSVATTKTAFSDVKVKCTPAGTTPTWQFTGLYGNAPLRMKHSLQNAFIPYSVAPSLLSSSGANQSWRLTATVLGTDYQNALVGSYSDTLTATITP